MENKGRRSFLKLGVVAAVALAAGGAIYRSRNPSSYARNELDQAAQEVLRALIPALLHGALPPVAETAARQAAIEAALKNTQIAISGLPYHSQKEVADLFGLLSMSLSRRLLTGLSSDWKEAKLEDISACLQEWRTHRTETLQTAYHAMHDLVLGPWYGNPANWQHIGYPGPLKELSN